MANFIKHDENGEITLFVAEMRVTKYNISELEKISNQEDKESLIEDLMEDVEIIHPYVDEVASEDGSSFETYVIYPKDESIKEFLTQAPLETTLVRLSQEQLTSLSGAVLSESDETPYFS